MAGGQCLVPPQLTITIVHLAVFLFVMIGIVYETQHWSNPEIRNYIDARYCTVTALTTTGFGDITLKGTPGRLISVVIMIFGVTVAATNSSENAKIAPSSIWFVRFHSWLVRPSRCLYRTGLGLRERFHPIRIDGKRRIGGGAARRRGAAFRAWSEGAAFFSFGHWPIAAVWLV